MEFGVEAARQAWSRLAGIPLFDGLQVVVDPESPLGPRGWIAILAVGTTVTASVPRPELREPVITALTGLIGEEATTPEVVIERLPPARTTLGPAALFYPPPQFTMVSQQLEEASPQEFASLLAAASADELNESGLPHIESPAFVSRSSDGVVVAACGYRRWPNGVAHMSALTHPDHREEGHGRHRRDLRSRMRSIMNCSRSGERARSHPSGSP